MKYTDESTAVEARFGADGAIQPRRFTWNETWLDVNAVGRQWEDEAGRHVLVMVADRQTYELFLGRETLTWRVVRASGDLAFA